MFDMDDVKEIIKTIKAYDQCLKWAACTVVAKWYDDAAHSWSSVIPEKRYFREWRKAVNERKAGDHMTKLYWLYCELYGDESTVMSYDDFKKQFEEIVKKYWN